MPNTACHSADIHNAIPQAEIIRKSLIVKIVNRAIGLQVLIKALPLGVVLSLGCGDKFRSVICPLSGMNSTLCVALLSLAHAVHLISSLSNILSIAGEMKCCNEKDGPTKNFF